MQKQMRHALGAIMTIVITLTCSSPAAAQELKSWEVTSVSVGSGETPISAGLTGTIVIEKGRNLIDVTVQEEQAWVMLGRKWQLGKIEMTTNGTLAHFQSAVVIGPFLNAKLPLGKIGGHDVSVSLLEWPAFFVGAEPKNWRTENDGVENPERLKVGWYTQASAAVGGLTFSYVWLNFLDDPLNRIPGVSYTTKLRKDFDVNFSVSYNSATERPMYFIGATWSPGK